MATWDLTLPQAFEHGSFNESSLNGSVRTNMSTGPAKQRRRFTAVPRTWTGTMIMTKIQLVTFRNFYTNTILLGSAVFLFPDQYNLETNINVRFKTDGNAAPYKIKPDGDTLDWAVSMTLEVLP